MYKLIRRISSSFFPRPGRPLDESDAEPVQIGRKRRMSTAEPEDEPSPAPKRIRADTEEASEGAAEEDGAPSQSTNDTQDVKEATEGVRELELVDAAVPGSSGAAEAAAVPLPASPTLKAAGAENLEKEGVPDVPADIPSAEEVVVNGVHEAEVIPQASEDETKEEGIEVQKTAELDEEEIPGLLSSADLACAKAAKAAGKPASDEVVVVADAAAAQPIANGH